MSTRLTLGDVKASVAEILGVGSSDSKVADYVNKAQKRLMDRGQWVGTMLRYACCVNSGILTWPRQINTIEAYAICDYPGTIRNHWYEFLGSGTYKHKADECSGGLLIDRGMGCAFDDVIGTDKKIKVYCDASEDAGAQILIQYWDEDGNFVRTNSGGSWIDGELIDLNNSVPQLSSYVCLANGLVAVQKPVTNGTVRLYEYDTETAAERPLAFYEPSETRPTYRRSLIPGLENMGKCSDSEADCENKTVTILAKLRHIDVSADRDWLILQNAPAIDLMVQALWAEKTYHYQSANRLIEGVMNPITGQMENGAIPLLQAELNNYHGAGAVPTIRYEDNSIFGCGNI